MPRGLIAGQYREIVFTSDMTWRKFYRTRFAARRGVVLHLVNLGWSFEDCVRLLADVANAGSALWTHGQNGRLLSRTETYRRLREDYESARRKAGDSPSFKMAEDARQFIGLVTGDVERYRWRGRSGRTDRDVMKYILGRATAIACTLVNVSVRDAALGAGITRGTAHRSLLRLCAAGWLKRAGIHEFALAHAYQILRKVVRDNGTYEFPSTPRELYVPKPRTSPDHEVWLHLGKSAMDLWRVLPEHPISARKLAPLADMCDQTARRHLPRLALVGLAVGNPRDGWAVGPLDPDEVVSHQGWVKEDSLADYRRQDVADDRMVFRHRFKIETDQAA